MPLFPSSNILAKDIIGWAIELAGAEEARTTLRSVGRMYYNMAISEIQTLLGFVDAEALMKSAMVDVSNAVGNYKEASLSSLGDYDKVIALELTNRQGDYEDSYSTWVNSQNIESNPLPIKEFLIHKANMASDIYLGAKYPYNESAVYTVEGDKLHILWGEDLDLNSPTCKVYYTRQITLLTSSNYDTAKMDLPDKYAFLLANRIVAYVEQRQGGISEKSIAVVQNSYNQMISTLEPQMRSKIYNSFQFKPTFEPNDENNNNPLMGR